MTRIHCISSTVEDTIAVVETNEQWRSDSWAAQGVSDTIIELEDGIIMAGLREFDNGNCRTYILITNNSIDNLISEGFAKDAIEDIEEIEEDLFNLLGDHNEGNI